MSKYLYKKHVSLVTTHLTASFFLKKNEVNKSDNKDEPCNISGLFRAENRRVQFMSNYCNSTQFAQNCSKLTGAISFSQKSTGAFAPVTPF